MKGIRPSITAHLDLLGFSAHLTLAKYDIRSKIGDEAVNRLNRLEEALRFIEAEKEQFPEFYPDNLKYIRLNDSLIFQIDIDETFLPSIGATDIFGPSGARAMEWAKSQKIKEDDFQTIHKELLGRESKKVANFLGAVSRTHNYINIEEGRAHFPGCRTVVASGLRKSLIDRHGKDDFLAINFSLTNAYHVQENVEKKGIEGNLLYLDDNVARVMGQDHLAQRFLFYAQFPERFVKPTPYYSIPALSDHMVISRSILGEPRRIDVELSRQQYTFTEINTTVSSNFQFINLIEKYDSKAPPDNEILKRYCEVLHREVPQSNKLLATEHYRIEYPFYYFMLDLNEGNSIKFYIETDRSRH